jgi:predicted transcriptional regulator
MYNGSATTKNTRNTTAAAAAAAAARRGLREIAIVTDAMIESVLRHFKAELYMSCSISTV